MLTQCANSTITLPFAEQRWKNYSADAWGWLGWNAPTSDGTSITRYPMDYFIED